MIAHGAAESDTVGLEDNDLIARIVQSIGDEVMIASDDHATTTKIALELIASFAGHESIQPRRGVGAGEVLVRLGDYYGPIANMAARLVDVAAPGEVLTDRAPSATDEVELRPAGTRELKGFDHPAPVWSTSQ